MTVRAIGFRRQRTDQPGDIGDAEHDHTLPSVDGGDGSGGQNRFRRSGGLGGIRRGLLGQRKRRLHGCGGLAESPLLMKLNQLSPSLVDYRAANKYHFDGEGELVVEEWNEEWRNAMMKQSIDKASGAVKGYSFNNATENISATRHLLAKKIGLADVEETDQADVADAA